MTADAQRLYRATILMSAGTALSRITGLLRVAAMAFALGVTGTRLADTYNLANTTPNIIFELFLGGIFTAVFVPLLIELKAGRRGDASALISVSLVALAVVSALAALGAPFVMRMYTFRIPDPEVRAEQLELATFLLRWFAPQIFFYGLSAIAQALLNVRRRFGAPAFAPVLNNLVVSGMFLFYAQVIAEQGLDLSARARLLLGAGTTAGVVLQAVVLLPLLRGEGLRFRPAFRDPAVASVLRRSLFVVGYVVVNQIGLWMVLALANQVRGGVTSYQVAFMFFQLPHGLFAVSLHTALFPDLSQAAAQRDWASYRSWFASGIRGVAFLLLPAAVGYFILAEPITRLVLARGVAGIEDAAAVASVLRAFAVGLAFFSGFQLLTRCFYALGDTKTPTALNAVAVGVHIGVNLPLFAWLGVPGLAYGHAIAYTAGSVLLLTLLSRRVPDGLDLRALAPPLLRIAVAAGLMGLGVRALAAALPGPELGVVAAAVAGGAILYLVIAKLAGIPETKMLLTRFSMRREHEGDE